MGIESIKTPSKSKRKARSGKSFDATAERIARARVGDGLRQMAKKAAIIAGE